MVINTTLVEFAGVAGDAGSILAGATASSLIGAVYPWLAGLAVGKKISAMMLIVAAGAL